MLDALRSALYRRAVTHHLADLSFLETERDLARELRGPLSGYLRRGRREKWSPRTMAAVVTAVRLAHMAARLPPERRREVGEEIVRTGAGSARAALDWLDAFDGGRTNVVGLDGLLVRFNVANGVLAGWLAAGQPVHAAVQPVLLAAMAWALAGRTVAEIENDLGDLLAALSARTSA